MPKKVSVHRHSSPPYHANVPHNIHAPIRHHATNTHNPHNKCNTRAKRQQQQTSACTTVKNNTIIPSTQNIEKIHATKQPHNRKTLRSFLKAVNAYKEFIPDHARLRTPLVNLLKKDVMWVWSDECQKAFTNLKESLTTHPTLYLYQEDLPCQVYCNTSTFGIAGILKQVYPDGNTYPVQHFSRSLRGHERNYSDLELQCLAIVESVDNFRACLMGRKFTILSDHPALQWLKEIKAPSGRLFRWRLRLSRYEYEVRSINGVQQYETGVVTRIPFCGFLDAPLINSQQSSPPGKSRVTMDHNKLRTVSRKGVLKTIVPSSLTTRLLKSVHTQHHHPNISRMTRLISSQYYWQNMTQDIAKQVKTCPTCRFARRIDEYNQPSRKNTDTGPKAKQNSYIKHSVHTTQTMPKLHHPRQNDHTAQPKSITTDISLIKPLTIKQENCEPTNHLNSTINKIYKDLISTLQLVERLDRYPLRNKRKIDSVEPEETSMNVLRKEGRYSVDKSIELKQINSTLSRMEGIKPPAEFVPYSNEKKWETWRESFEIFAIAVNLESMPLVRQRAILKHIAGEKTVMIYKTFHISENDTYLNVKEMLDMLTNHFKPFKNTIQRRNAFFTCVQKEKQGIMEFVTELKHLAQECEFENLTESLIRDRLIIGILDREVKRKLLEDPQLTLPRAISIAVISESTCSQVASLNEQKMIEKIEKRNWVKDTIRMENAEAGPSGINPRRERIIEPCKWCGQRHKYGKCPAYGKKCNACGKTNHFSVVCRTKRIRNLLAESEAEESCDEINLNEVAVKTVRSDKWSAVIIINGKKTTVHLDTGAQINVLPHKVINQWPSRPEIRPTSLKAFAYGNTELPIVGKCNVLCQYGEKKGMFEFIVADVEAQTLITGDTCEKLEILRRINHINTDEMKLCSETQKILEQYHEVFQGVGLINSECKIYTKPEYSPVQVPPRRIPTSLGAEVQSELEKMVKQGIVTKIYHETEWSHPMVVVKKKSGQIRICLDPRKLNEALVGRHFQTPAPAELLHEIPKAKYYTVLDVKSAYWHIPVAKECRDLLVMTTPFGKFRYNRLPFGLKISAHIFVEKMTNIFRDSFQNITYVDDLLIYADTIQKHNKKLKGILEKAKEKNIKFDLTKAQICLTKVRFLGHVISQNGIDPEPNKIDKLITFKRPEDKKSLQRIMGLYNYLGKFIPNLAASTSNIRGILRKNVVWHWGPKQDGEFDHIKECEDRPLAFASASFSDSQKQYSQIEKELLSVYYGCKKFEYLLSGHTFVVQTDHQPLLPLVKKPLSDISPRLQRLVMKLIAFDFKLQYKPGKYLIVADTLSRDTHPMDELPTPFLEDKRMVKMVRVNISDEKLVAMQKDTREDPALVKVIDYVIEGWPICKKDVDEDAKIFFDFRHRLYLWNDLLCIGSAIVIPKTQRNAMLNLLHQSHQGISAIQGLARESLFWPRMSIDIAEKGDMDTGEDSAQADSPQSFEVVTPSGNRLIINQQFIRPRDGGYEKSQLSSEPITASPEAQHPQCYSPTMGESSTAPIQRSSEETNIDQREGATTSAGIAPEPSGRPRFSSEFVQTTHTHYNNWDETLCLTKVYFYLSGTALKWFENNEEIIQTWKEFTSQLENVFGKKENSKLQAEKKLKTRAQLKGKSTEFYNQDVLCLCKEVDPQMSEEDKISHLMKGIAEELYQALLPRDVQSTEQFITECRRVEALRCRRVTPTRYERLPNVASLCDQDDGEDLSSLIRQIVREEVQRVLGSPREELKNATIEEIVKEEIGSTLAPISKSRRSPPHKERPRQFLNTRYEAETIRPTLNLDTQNKEEDATPMIGVQLREGQSVSTADAQVTSSAIAVTERDTMRKGEMTISKESKTQWYPATLELNLRTPMTNHRGKPSLATEALLHIAVETDNISHLLEDLAGRPAIKTR
ncbi:K02A2.6-like [Cordylochernes scorpioides]|uniref:RNA-directed DNA polymerase n=1 Tax=Cordylochernes scorpioides TaxID=51811 RepID=A0ABY6LAD9_9ARAC|nr:K02A2.6-like [Cordylochernes scorpioides]